MSIVSSEMFDEIKEVMRIKEMPFQFHKDDIFRLQLLKAAEGGANIYENEVNRLDNLPVARMMKNQYSITDIFRNHWEEFKAIQAKKGKPIRKSILKNVDLMINCRNLKNGYLFFECPRCNNFHIQGLSCHSRFCPSCGKKYRDARANEISKTIIYAPHRHITWTIAKELRDFFQRHRDMYDFLFEAVNDVLTYVVTRKSKAVKKAKRKLGFISTIHTFGRDMKFNPHIHTICSECTVDKDGDKKPFNSFDFYILRKSFMNHLLKKIYHHLKNNASFNEFNSFCKIRKQLYQKHKNGFYVHSSKINVKNRKAFKKTISYLIRYSNHPALSESRILHYDKDTKMIYYYYDSHEDDHVENENDKVGRQYVKESVYEFIAKLIVHISEDKVHTTRYYGFYANRSTNPTEDKPKLFSLADLKDMKKNQDWRYRLLTSYKYDPLICSCGATMVFCREQSYFKGYEPEDFY